MDFKKLNGNCFTKGDKIALVDNYMFSGYKLGDIFTYIERTDRDETFDKNGNFTYFCDVADSHGNMRQNLWESRFKKVNRCELE